MHEKRTMQDTNKKLKRASGLLRMMLKPKGYKLCEPDYRHANFDVHYALVYIIGGHGCTQTTAHIKGIIRRCGG
jgi:predicted secreted protein|tara:strand:- start:6709 stop:6930 length:222 start_codon:yes stop_codon:yes gene_type:complete